MHTAALLCAQLQTAALQDSAHNAALCKHWKTKVAPNFKRPWRQIIRLRAKRRAPYLRQALCRHLASRLLFSEAIFAGHSGDWRAHLVQPGCGDTERLPREKSDFAPPTPTPRRRPDDATVPVNLFTATQSPSRALATIFFFIYHRKWHRSGRNTTAQKLKLTDGIWGRRQK